MAVDRRDFFQPGKAETRWFPPEHEHAVPGALVVGDCLARYPGSLVVNIW